MSDATPQLLLSVMILDWMVKSRSATSGIQFAECRLGPGFAPGGQVCQHPFASGLGLFFRVDVLVHV